jgi:hypothetical protein
MLVAVEVALEVGDGVNVAVPVGLGVTLWVGDDVGVALVARRSAVHYAEITRGKRARMGKKKKQSSLSITFRLPSSITSHRCSPPITVKKMASKNK